MICLRVLMKIRIYQDTLVYISLEKGHLVVLNRYMTPKKKNILLKNNSVILLKDNKNTCMKRV